MKQTLTAYTTGAWQVQGGELVAPVILVREGVHRGSHGSIYWPEHVLRENAEKWNNVPVTLDHPMENDQPVSVNHSRQIREGYTIGRITDVYFDPQKKAIRGKVRIPSNSPEANRVQDIREVSMGVFSDERYEGGQYNGKEYHACAISMSPDHVALLPDDQGACSWADGCGIRNNASPETLQILQEAMRTTLQFLNGGNSQMSNEEILGPPGVFNDREKEIADEEEYAERHNILPPPGVGQSKKQQPEQQDNDKDILLPIIE